MGWPVASIATDRATVFQQPIWAPTAAEDLAMERFIQLNLQTDRDRAEPSDAPTADRKEQEAPVLSKRLHRLVNKAAHKAAGEFGRSKSQLFSK